MTERNFTAEFERLVAVDAAAKDRTLRYFYWDLMHGRSQVLPEAHSLIEDEICHAYNLSADQYRQALTRCLADILDVRLGSEVKNGQA